MSKASCNETEIELQATLVTDLLKLLLQTKSRSDCLAGCLGLIKNWADIQCAGIRILDKRGNIPYHSQSGFPQKFIEDDQWLSIVDDKCVCIRVMQGQIEQSDLPRTTAGGSFWCNDTKAFMSELNDLEKANYRSICFGGNYRSLAIIPIKYHQETLGLFHMVDTRKEVFTQSQIDFLESSVAPVIGEGLYRFNIEDKLEHNLETQTALTTLLKNSQEDLPLNNILNLTLDLIHAYQPFTQEVKSAIFLADEDPDIMVLKISRNFSESEYELCSQIDLLSAHCGKFMKKGEIYLAGVRINNESPFPSGHYSVPILFQKSVLGMICINLSKDYHADEMDEQFLNAIATTLASIVWRKRSKKLLQTLSMRLVTIQEEERRAIALELHDQIGQMLTGLKLMIGHAVRSNDNLRPEVLKEAQDTVIELIVSVREMSLNLRPSMLDDLGLLPTLIWHFQRVNTQSGLQVEFRHSGLDNSFSKDTAVAAYRIIQEALTNAVKYSGVKQVLIEIWTDLDMLLIRIEDKGKGFNPDEVSSATSFGLQGMQERAILLGGQFSIDSTPGEGTVIFAQLPLKNKSDSVTISNI